jgi:hypothetical protein
LPFVNAKFRGVALLFLFNGFGGWGKKHSFHVMCHISLTEKQPAKEEGMDLTKIVHDARQEKKKGLGLPQHDSERQRRQFQLAFRRQIWFV